MKIGIDFDQTIVNYDQIFHDVAIEWKMLPAGIPANKLSIRDFFRKAGKEELWTLMQGYVYGVCIQKAAAYPGLLDFMKSALAAGHEISIISHKTVHPFLGPRYDLHGAAHQWIQNNLCIENETLLPNERIFFEITKEKKLQRIAETGCDLFIDDLPEILLSPLFPQEVSTILFDPDAAHSSYSGRSFSSWKYIQQALGLV